MKLWVNIYKRKDGSFQTGAAYKTKGKAQLISKDHIVAIVPIEFEEGDGLDNRENIKALKQIHQHIARVEAGIEREVASVQSELNYIKHTMSSFLGE